jgi:CBS domain-containing protein
MRIADICSQRVVCIGPDASISEAAQLMHDQDVGALVVIRDGKREPIGIVTDRDIAMRIVPSGRDPRAVPVSEAMSGAPATCHGNHDLLDVMEMMRQHGIRRVPVVDAKSTLVGIVTTDDIIGALAEHVLVLARSVSGEAALERRRHRDARVAASVGKHAGKT